MLEMQLICLCLQSAKRNRVCLKICKKNMAPWQQAKKWVCPKSFYFHLKYLCLTFFKDKITSSLDLQDIQSKNNKKNSLAIYRLNYDKVCKTSFCKMSIFRNMGWWWCKWYGNGISAFGMLLSILSKNICVFLEKVESGIEDTFVWVLIFAYFFGAKNQIY